MWPLANNMDKKPQRYYWQGINHKGNTFVGIREASSITSLKTELGKQGILVRKIKRANYFSAMPKLSQSAITIFCRQLATMLKAGIPLTQSFDIVANSPTSLCMRSLIEELKKEVESGRPFYEALQQRPYYFNELVCNLIACGEKSGKLEHMLDKVASYKEKIASLQQKLQKALSYPLIVVFIALSITIALLEFVVPQFQALFTSFGAELPALTQLMINLTSLLERYWLAMLMTIALLIWGLILARRYAPWFTLASDQFILKLPLIGAIISKTIIARFTQTLALCFNAGLPIVEALDAVNGISRNQVYVRAIHSIKEEVLTGQQLHLAMAKTTAFPSMAIQMIKIGEESGTLELMLIKVADFYEEGVNSSIDILMNLLEPIIMVILGLIIGGLVIAMYLPVFKLGSVV
ncbi:General secretion pathway protein F [Legionella massiliensis]|uniref:General secretion pathway protein F n=1 Tax=Legionella massiliensis TaxID=1034943 RepID=A0A078L2I6_9GAMM|nr:type II secretion system F family protein [Legionella massiliensis]CDZ78329.1 General secretion pathway protein F [Legionella massiliensis]CEE14067.1 Type II secretion system protein F [Legionella massiliensis]